VMTVFAERLGKSPVTLTRILAPMSICPFSFARRIVDEMVGGSLWI
jgi:hypothetical protein